MMSPRPPPPPIFPRETSLSTVSEPPRPLHATTFSSNQLPPPLSGGGYAPRTYGGPHLAPIPISATSSGGSATHQQHQSAPHPQHTIPSPHPSTPYLPSTQSDANFRRGYLPDRFTSPASPSTYSPASYPYDQRPEHASTRRFSHEHSPENRGERPSLPAMIPSPAYTIKRSSEELYQDEQPYTSSRYTPTSAEDSGNYRPEMPHNRSSGRYRITVRQQPVAARACGFGERDRRVIDPPPIVQLLVTDSTGRPDSAELRYPFNVVHCTLWSVDGLTDETALTGQDKRHTRRLMGTLVSSPFVGTDEEGKEGCFFCFPDLSCRTHGKYRLRFVLMRLEPSELSPEGCTPIITETMSEPFTVYTAKEFPGMRPSTALTKALKRQGCAISVKKGNEKTMGGSGSGDEDDKVDSRTSSAPRKRIRNGDK